MPRRKHGNPDLTLPYPTRTAGSSVSGRSKQFGSWRAVFPKVRRKLVHELHRPPRAARDGGDFDAI